MPSQIYVVLDETTHLNFKDPSSARLTVFHSPAFEDNAEDLIKAMKADVVLTKAVAGAWLREHGFIQVDNVWLIHAIDKADVVYIVTTPRPSLIYHRMVNQLEIESDEKTIEKLKDALRDAVKYAKLAGVTMPARLVGEWTRLLDGLDHPPRFMHGFGFMSAGEMLPKFEVTAPGPIAALLRHMLRPNVYEMAMEFGREYAADPCRRCGHGKKAHHDGQCHAFASQTDRCVCEEHIPMGGGP